MDEKKLNSTEFARHSLAVAISAETQRLAKIETTSDERESIRAFLIEGAILLGVHTYEEPLSDDNLFNITDFKKRGDFK